ncbi:ribosomal protein L7/L12 [Streptomyces albidocamelliae]|uniref:Ribosomal protein L7/L12 n=1 Tax=Streptomyces albidocamelliae TaxID=2981135 RepID=A0ABY6EIK0_9ACTN|nr:ribosomal protein L7/L12 [Streptomyces sp. HUAS 14-6]UXY33276.1 ribosomal protein L7/L12 [Streptomyces sp. HUAS 14-6]
MEEPGFCVLLVEAGGRKTDAVRAIRTLTGLSLFESKLLLDRAPAEVTEPVWFEAAQDAARVLEGAGVHATVVCDWCDRTVNRGGRPARSGPVRGAVVACRIMPGKSPTGEGLLTNAPPRRRDRSRGAVANRSEAGG